MWWDAIYNSQDTDKLRCSDNQLLLVCDESWVSLIVILWSGLAIGSVIKANSILEGVRYVQWQL